MSPSRVDFVAIPDKNLTPDPGRVRGCECGGVGSDSEFDDDDDDIFPGKGSKRRCRIFARAGIIKARTETDGSKCRKID